LFYLKNAGLIESTRRGLFKITQKGSSEVLAEKADKIDLRNFSVGFLGSLNL
jgi:predicted transcriptional regulator